MASSSYYLERSKEKANEAKKYEGRISDLIDIKDKLSNDMYDEIEKINNERSNLVFELQGAVRHNSCFTQETNEISAFYEKLPASDARLSLAIDDLEQEILRLERAKLDAEEASDNYYQKYKRKKAQEKAARERRKKKE